MLKVLVNGCTGKMGQEVIDALSKDENLLLIAGVGREDNGEYAFPVYTNFENIKEKPDVVIDFSVPIATLNLLEYAKNEKIPTVIATTGFTEEQNKKIREYSKYIPIFKSGNMSYEINIMCKLVAELAKKMTESDIEIVETHHNRKIDCPSGTAAMLADSINEALNNKMYYEYNRHDKHEKRSKNEIGISSIRGGNIVGEHTVQFFSENETFEIKHVSYSRQVFAQGAIKAARFIVKQEAGLYNMDDLI